jgi:hypothetical protein
MQPKAEYSKFKKKYRKLPDWDWLNKNFKIKIEDDGQLLDQIRSAVVEKLDMITHSIIEPIIGGGENYCCYYERGMLSHEERLEMFQLYKVLQSLLWKSNSVSVDFSEKAVADWLIGMKEEFDRIRPDLTRICDKLSIGWKNYKKEEVETAYHG